jgi:RHS repeat-associated protein
MDDFVLNGYVNDNGNSSASGVQYANNGGYRFGFNGQMKSEEIGGDSYTALYWEYDARTGRRWNVDPVDKVGESPYLTFGGNPIVMVDPNGDDWYKDTKGKNKGDVVFMEGSGKHKGYKNITGEWTKRNSRGFSYLYGHGKDDILQSGSNDLLKEVVVTGKGKKKDNSIMERMLQVSNVTQADRDAYSASHPRSSEASVWKTVFWDATVGALNPVKDVDIYASASIKQKQEYSAGISRTLVVGGGQVGFTTAANQSGSSQGFYANFLDLRNSYGSVKIAPLKTELRFIPLNGIGSNNNALFGDYSPSFRSLTDFNFRGIPCQFETGMGLKNGVLNPSIGLRAKQEIQWINGWSGEAVIGARLHLQLPPLIQAIMNQ